MTYFQNIQSLADLKKEYRRLAMLHHPDKGGDTALMQQVNTEFGKLFEVWKDKPCVSTTRQATNTTFRVPPQRNTPNTCTMNTAGKGATTTGSPRRKSRNWSGHGSRRPIRDTPSQSAGTDTAQSLSG